MKNNFSIKKASILDFHGLWILGRFREGTRKKILRRNQEEARLECQSLARV